MSNDGALQSLFPLAGEGLREKLRVLSRVKGIFNALPLKYKKMLCERCPQNLSCLGLLRLELLLEGMPAKALTLSSAILRKLRMIGRGNEFLAAGGWSHDNIFEAFYHMGETSVDFLLLKGRTELLSEYERYRMIMKYGLLPAEEIISFSGSLSGAEVGRVIKMVKKAEFNYRVSSREDATSLLHRYCNDLT
jgi:hypothetical protein